MCFSESASWIGFALALSVSIAAGIDLDEKYRWFVIVWLYGALMQIPEGITWHNIGNKSLISRRFNVNLARVAYFLNITQPIATMIIALWLAWFWGDSMTDPYKIVVYIMMFIYLIGIPTLTKIPNKSLISGGCGIKLNYWENTPTLFKWYFFILFIAIIGMYPKYRIISIFLFVSSFTIAKIFYSSFSVWCFLIVFAPAITWAWIHADQNGHLPVWLTY